jgi:hypothetical protein
MGGYNGETYIETLANDIKPLLAHNNLNYVLLDYPFAYKNDKIKP